jgi:DnaJ-class molecular chaperone
MTPQTWQEVLQARAWHRGAIEAINEALSRASDAESATIAILLEIQNEHTGAWTKLAGYQACGHCGGKGSGYSNLTRECEACGGTGFYCTPRKPA